MALKKTFILIVACACANGSVWASLINFQSGVVSTHFQADGETSMSAAPEGTYQFALGTFDESILTSSSDQWITAFEDQMESTNVWKTTGPTALQDRFQNEHLMEDGSASGDDAYIFGYRDDLSEIIVFRNSNWVFPSFNALDVEADIFSLEDGGTEIINASGSWDSYAGNITMLAAVPEPSTYAALAGLCALAWVAVRRRR